MPRVRFARIVGEEIAVRRAEQRAADPSAPGGFVAPELGPDPPGREPVAAAVERVGMLEGDRIVAVELGCGRSARTPTAPSSHVGERAPASRAPGPTGCDSRPCRRRARRSCRCRSRAASRPRRPGWHWRRRPLPDALARRKAERAGFGAARHSRAHHRVPLTAITPPIASDPHKRRLRPAHDFDARGEIGVEQLEARRVAGGRVVDLDPVDEQQGVVGLGAADADFGQRAGRAPMSRPRPTASGEAGRGPAARRAVRSAAGR